jgi:pilus assembly protein Flp/PilA
MKAIPNTIWKLKLWIDNHGQDLVDYALVAGFMAVAAGAISPVVADGINSVFSKLSAAMTSSAQNSAR